jgi:hypothetical protein
MDRCRCAGALDEPAANEVSLWADGLGAKAVANISHLKSASRQEFKHWRDGRLSVVIEANMGFWPRTTERHVQLS